jgi:sortase A
MAAATLPFGLVEHPKTRSAAPRDRWFWLAGVGRTMIGFGLLLLAFVAYQLWGTGLQHARSQDRLANRFTELSSSVAPPTGSTTPPVTRPTNIPTNAPTDSGSTDTNTVPGSPGAADETVTIGPGDPIGVIDIPAIGVREFVVAGVASADLRRGPGHFPTTPFPGESGNASIAGHRSTYGEPFADLDDLSVGDEIVMEMLGGGRYVYRIDSTRIVEATAVDVVLTTEPDVARLTLTTCHPRWSAAQRLVVSGVLDVTASSETGAQPITVSEDDRDLGVDPVNDEVPPETSDDPRSTDEIADAFGAGWFSDPAAWPHVIAWGLAVLAVGLGIWWLGRRLVARRRRRGRRWPGVARVAALAIGAVPFLLSLYFAFENLSRLLPPDL